MYKIVLLVSLNILSLTETKVTINKFDDKCYDSEKDYFPFKGTRTAYDLVHGYIGRPEATCTPKQIWALVRHGSRYPDPKVVRELLNLTDLQNQIIENHENNRGKLCIEDLEKLKNWQLDPDLMERAGDLTDEGKEELKNLGNRLQNAFPELLHVEDPLNIPPEDFVFLPTKNNRTKDSLIAFAEGLFGENNNLKPQKVPKNDTMLLFYKNCPAWRESYKSEHVTIEQDKFIVGPESKNVVKEVSERLGFTEELEYGQVKSMHEICRYESAWKKNHDSPWCMLFSKQNMEYFEYVEDLNRYYCCGPGREMSNKIGCRTLMDMFDHFKKLETEDSVNQPKGVFYFGHSTTHHTLMAVLNISKESTPMLSTNFAESENRYYRTSILAPFATSVVAVFYRCTASTSPNKVMFYISEKLISLPGCRDGLCDWELIKNEYSKYTDHCTTDFCYNYKPPENITNTSTTTLDIEPPNNNNNNGNSSNNGANSVRTELALKLFIFFILTRIIG